MIEIKREQKPLRVPVVAILFYIAVLVSLIFTIKKFVIKPDESKLLSALRSDPVNSGKAYDLARYYHGAGEFGKAAVYYKQGLALSAEGTASCDIYYELAETLIKTKQFDAVYYIEKALGSDCQEERFLSLYEDAVIMITDKIASHIAHYRDNDISVRKHKEIRDFYIKKGFVLSFYFDTPRKDVFYRLFSSLFPDRAKRFSGYNGKEPSHLFELGKLANEAEMYDIAESLLRKALPGLSGENRGISLYYLGFNEYRKAKYSAALELYLDAKKYYNTTKLNYWLAKTYWELGMKDKARQAIEFTLKMDPKYRDALEFKQKITKGE